MTVELNERILKQVEFYFSDANLPRDKFLSAEAAKSAEGWVPLSVICSFSRMRALGAENVEQVATALRASRELLEVSEDGQSVRRAVPLADRTEDALSRTLYIKGFPRDNAVTLDAIREALESAGMIGIEAVRMRRFAKSKDFRGSVFVEFASVQDLETARGCKPQYLGADLSIETKQDYMLRKNAERLAGTAVPERAEPVFAPGCLLVVPVSAEDERAGHAVLKTRLESKLEGIKVAFVDFEHNVNPKKEEDAKEEAELREDEVKEGAEEMMAMVRLKEPRAAELVAALGEGARIATEAEEAAYYDSLRQILRTKEATAGQKRRPSGRQGSARKQRRSD